MSLAALIIILLVIGVAITFIPMDPDIRKIIIGVVAIIALVVVLKQLAVF